MLRAYYAASFANEGRSFTHSSLLFSLKAPGSRIQCLHLSLDLRPETLGPRTLSLVQTRARLWNWLKQ